MAWYRLYVKSVGGGTECVGPYEYKNERDAVDEAYNMAVEDYESFAGYHGIVDIGEIMECPEDFGLDSDADEEACWEAYYEEREGWLNYWVEEAHGPDDIDEDYQ